MMKIDIKLSLFALSISLSYRMSGIVHRVHTYHGTIHRHSSGADTLVIYAGVMKAGYRCL